MATVLLVEDDEDTRELIAHTLRVEKHITHAFATAEEGAADAAVTRPDLALLDIHLPGNTGVSLAWELRQRWPELPIIIMSSALEEWDRDDLKDCGASELLSKPFEVKHLLSLVRHYVGGRTLRTTQEARATL